MTVRRHQSLINKCQYIDMKINPGNISSSPFPLSCCFVDICLNLVKEKVSLIEKLQHSTAEQKLLNIFGMYSWIHSFREINKAKRPKLEELYRLEIPVVINKFIFIVFTAILQQGIGCMVRILLYIFLF